MIFHIPVLVAEVIQFMRLKPGKIYGDCTVGGGGHLLSMAQASPQSRFIGIDWDPDAIAYAQETLAPYKDRITLVNDNYINLGLILEQHDIKVLDGILFDCGVSYHQVTTPDRGFSYEYDGPLSMQMTPDNPRLQTKLRNATREDIAMVLKRYGDVRSYRRIADLLFVKRAHCETTADLRAIVAEVTPPRFLKKNCRRVFQALRIWVNDELENIAHGFDAGFNALTLHGRMVTIAYHSGEDRIVKQHMRALHKYGTCQVLTKKVVRATEDEIHANPRARSARLRVCEKCVLS